MLEVADDERVARERRTRARDIPRNPCVVRHQMRPDDLACRRIELPERAAKVAEVHRSVHDGRRRGHVARNRRHPLERQATHVRWPDRVLEGLIATVRRIVADHPPVRSTADGRSRPHGAREGHDQSDDRRDPRETQPRPSRLLNPSNHHDSSPGLHADAHPPSPVPPQRDASVAPSFSCERRDAAQGRRQST